jgi:hypothetical protein
LGKKTHRLWCRFGEGGLNAFLAKYDAVGNQPWNLVWDGASIDYSCSVATATDGIYLVGEFYDSIPDVHDARIVIISTAVDVALMVNETNIRILAFIAASTIIGIIADDSRA